MYKGVLLLLAVFVLAGCAQRAQGAAPADAGATPIVVNTGTGMADAGAPARAAIALAPATGYAGTFVSVTGTGWPPSAMVLIKLADAQGRSPVLAAVAADAKGQFTTGFVYPVGDRWLHAGSAAIVAHTENGRVETAAPFVVAPPAGVLPPTSTPTAVPPAGPTGAPANTLPITLPITMAVTAAATPTITATIPFTSGALAATPAPTATPVPPATATPAPAVPTPATPVTTAPPSATPAPTATAVPTVVQVGQGTYAAPVSTIDELIAAIRGMPSGDLAPELANSLVKKLSNAQKQTDKGHTTPAANMLRAFQHEVAAQSGKKIATDAATFLAASADNVIARLQADRAGAAGAGDDDSNDKGSGNGKGKDKDKSSGSGNGNGKSNGNGNGNGHDKGNGNGKGHG